MPSKTAATRKSSGFTADEKAAMQQRAKELKRANEDPEEGRRLVAEAIAGMPEPDRTMAAHIDEIVTKAAPDLWPRTYYGMPAYAKSGKVICFFQPKSKFKVRYSTFGFQPDAKLDDGAMWPNAYAVIELTPDVEKRIADLVRKAAS